MNKNHSVRIPVTEQQLKELRKKSLQVGINLSEATRIMWRDWTSGKIGLGTIKEG